jgi:hypothetical protein
MAIINTVMIYIAIIAIILYVKPTLLYCNTDDGVELKQFGFGVNKTIFSLHSCSIFIIVIVHFFVSYIDSLLN